MSKGRVRLTESIRAPAIVVFAFLSNLDRVPDWDPRVNSVRKMTQGALRPGVILRSTLTVDGEEVYADDEVTEYDPPSRLGMRSVLGSTDAIAYALSEDDSGITTVDVQLTYDLPDLPGGGAETAEGLRSAIASALTHSLKLFKQLVEQRGSLSA